MKISTENYVLTDRYGPLQAISMISDAGFEAFDASYYWLPDGSPLLAEGYLSLAERMRRKADECGIVCNQAHAPFAIKYGESFDEKNKNYRDIVRSIRAAGVLGAKVVVLHAIRIPKGINDTFHNYNLGFFGSLAPHAKKAGVKLGIENLFLRDEERRCIGGLLSSPEEINAIIDALDDDVFCACVDVGHASITDNDPADFIRKVGKKCLALHIQDCDKIDDRHMLPFTSKLNFASIREALLDIGYEGDVTLEIFKYYKTFPNERLAIALKDACSAARTIRESLKKTKVYV